MRIRAFLVVALAVLFIPAAAHAKGPTEASIEGSGVAIPIVVPLSDGGGLMDLAQETSLMAAMFEETPNPMRIEPPKGDLGPAIAITWRVPTGETTDARIRQTVYPYATGSPVVHTEPGQRTFETQVTYGGWYVASPRLTTMLTALGVPDRAALEAASRPATPPRVSSDDTTPWPTIVAVALLALAGVGAASLFLFGPRRRARVAATA